ncbi:unnamed protein product [Camellia sinensis]
MGETNRISLEALRIPVKGEEYRKRISTVGTGCWNVPGLTYGLKEVRGTHDWTKTGQIVQRTFWAATNFRSIVTIDGEGRASRSGKAILGDLVVTGLSRENSLSSFAVRQPFFRFRLSGNFM